MFMAHRRSNFGSNLRGQVATEFMLYTTVFMFIAVAAYVVVNQVQSSEIPLRQNVVAKETGESFATALTLAVKGGTGFSYNYSFPRTVFGAPYKVTFMPDTKSMIMDWQGQYGNFSYGYDLPGYVYSVQISGECLKDNVLVSNKCANVLNLRNDGKKLTIEQGVSS